ncbi:MAG TPA: hypothetical protein VFJ89_08580 [Nocardioides sp.]|nr:hypothetical protein [Nocardioides sp.]
MAAASRGVMDSGMPDDPDPLRPIEIDGGVVRRPAAARTPTVQAFLGHLRRRGLDVVPEPLGIDGDTVGGGVDPRPPPPAG